MGLGISLVLVLVFGLFSQSAFAQYQEFRVVEAECPTSFTGTYGSLQTNASGYSGLGFARSYGNTTVSSYNGSSSDTASYSFNLKNGGVYRAWFRVNTNGSADDDSWFHDIDGLSWQMKNDVYTLGPGWHWVPGNFAYPIGAGPTTITVANRENGLMIDKIALLPDGFPAPSGLGEPAYNCHTSYYFEAECRDQALEGYQVEYEDDRAGYSGTGYLESQDDNLVDPGASLDHATYYFETGSASYLFYFRVHTNGSYDDDSWFYRIDGGTWIQVNNAASQGSGWRWVQGPAGIWLAQGSHTLQVRNREDGLALDKIAFIPNGQPAPSGMGGFGVNCEPFELMSDWTLYETEQYEDAHIAYMAYEGAEFLHMHHEWHGSPNFNGSGGTAGPGSGVAFLGFHRAAQNRFERFILEIGGRLPLDVDTSAFLPVGLGDAFEPLQGTGFESEYAPRTSYDLTGVGMPPFLTEDGLGVGSWPATYDIGGLTVASLNDIPDLDTLGQVIGLMYHGIVHNQVGGTMASFHSPADPIFYGWHGKLDGIVDVWLKTPAGQAWVAANPTHPFLEKGFTDLSGWNNIDWAP